MSSWSPAQETFQPDLLPLPSPSATLERNPSQRCLLTSKPSNTGESIPPSRDSGLYRRPSTGSGRPANAAVRASLFVTCLVDQLFPEVGVSVVKVLRRLGVEVDFPQDQTCCGQAVFNSGFTQEARKLAQRVFRDFKDSQYIVVPSGSCTAMMRIFYPQLFHNDPELHKQAQELSGRIYEFSEFLVKVLGADKVGLGTTFQGKVTYHPSCHLLRELEVVQEPRALLQNIKGAEVVELKDAESCCGFGGTFSVKYPHISESMLDDKVRNVQDTGAQVLAACDSSCLMHISGALSRRGINIRPMHLAQLLAEEG